jgi:hypothetical protein
MENKGIYESRHFLQLHNTEQSVATDSPISKGSRRASKLNPESEEPSNPGSSGRFQFDSLNKMAGAPVINLSPKSQMDLFLRNSVGDGKHATVVSKKSDFIEQIQSPKERAMTTNLAASRKEPTKFELRDSGQDLRASADGLINETIEIQETPKLTL